MKHLLPAVFLFSLLLTPVLGAPIEVKVLDAVHEVESGGTATFKIVVMNNMQDPVVFKLTETPHEAEPFSKNIRSVRIEPRQLKIDPGKDGAAAVAVSFTDVVVYGKEYRAAVKITSLLNPEIFSIATLAAKIVNPNDVVQIIPDVPAVGIPGEEFPYSVRFVNRLNTALVDYDLMVTSDIAAFAREERVSFKPREELTRTYKELLAITTTPGTYALKSGVYKNGIVKGMHATAFSVAEKPLIEEKKDELKNFLKTTIHLSKKNTGNTASKQRVEVATSWFKDLFLTASLEPLRKDDALVWEATLEPGDEFALEITTNYRIVFYGFVAIVIATLLLLLYVDRSVTIKKRVFRVRGSEEGISELKLLIHVRNGTRRMLEHARVIDALPLMVELTPEFSTLKPDKIQQGTRSMRLIWDIASIAPHEERVITYKVKARLHIAGQVMLPPVSLHYMHGNTLMSVRSAPVTYRA